MTSEESSESGAVGGRYAKLAICSNGVCIGAGVGLFLGGIIVDGWNEAFTDPALAPSGLKGWQAAFFAVGLPGQLIAAWMWTLREPIRGLREGLVVEPEPHHGAFLREGASWSTNKF